MRPFILMSLITLAASSMNARAESPTSRPKSDPAQPIVFPKTAEAMLAPTPETVQFKAVTVRQAITELDKALGMHLEGNFSSKFDLDQGSLTLDAKKQPFWAVLASVCQQGGVEITKSPENSGPFAIGSPSSIQSQQQHISSLQNSSIVVAFSSWLNASDVATGRISLLAEPKVFILAHHEFLKMDEAIDADGNSMLAPPIYPIRAKGTSKAAPYRPTWNNEFPHEDFAVKIPAVGVHSYKRIKGSVQVVLGLDVHVFDLSALLKGKEVDVPVGKDRIAVAGFKMNSLKNYDEYDVELSEPASFAKTADDVMMYSIITGKRIFLYDADGRRAYASRGFRPPKADMHSNTTLLIFTPPEDPSLGMKPAKPFAHWKPVGAAIQMAGRAEEIVVPFEFDDLPG